MELNILSHDEMVKEFKNWGNFGAREQYIKEVGFVGLCKEFCDDLVETLKGRRVLGVMSGKGSIERVLKDGGIDAIATDTKGWAHGKQYESWLDEFVPVEELSALDAIEKYKSWADIVIMSWPYMDNEAYKIAVKLQQLNIPMLFIGEDWGGCTADNEFFDFIADYKEDDSLYENYFQFMGLHDYPRIINWELDTDN